MAGFKIKVKTDNPGASNNDQFTLPVYTSGYTYNYTIYWGDTSSTVVTTATNQTHTYSSAGTYEITIDENVAGGFPGLRFNNGGDDTKVTELSAWGTNEWATFAQAFYGCSNMTITATDHATADTSGVSSFYTAFRACSSITSFPLIDTSGATDFRYMFLDCHSLATLATLDTSGVTQFQYAFGDCAFTSFPSIDTSSGTDFTYTWVDNVDLTSFPTLNFSSATKIYGAWQNCEGLTSFPLITISSVTDADYAWNDCIGLTSFPMINFSNVQTVVSAWGDCSALTSFPLLNFSNMQSVELAWSGCTGLTSFPVIGFSNVTDFEDAWNGCTGLTSFPTINVSSGTDFESTWDGCTGLTTFPALNFASTTILRDTWQNCTGLTSFGTILIPNVTTLYQTWAGCTGLTSFPLIDTSSVTNMTWAWYNCSSLTTMPLIDISSVIIMSYTWRGCSSLVSLPALDFSSVQNGLSMCYECTSLTTLGSYNFDVLSNGSNMFFQCTLDSEVYSQMLQYLAANNVNTSVTFHGGSSEYYHFVQDDRDFLDVTQSWTITDGGTATETYGTFTVDPDRGPAGTVITITTTIAGFWDTMIIRDTDAGGTDLLSITVISWNELRATIPSNFVGPDIYVENPDGTFATIINAFFFEGGITGTRLDLSTDGVEPLDVDTIPFSNLPAFTHETILDGVVVRMKFAWNAANSAWNLDIYDGAGELLVAGIRLVLGLDMLSKYANSSLPGGQLMVVDPTEQLSDIGFEDFHNERGLQLIYLKKDNF